MSPMVKMRVKAMPGTKIEFEMCVGGVLMELSAFQIESSKKDMQKMENLQRRVPQNQLKGADEIDLGNAPRHPYSWLSNEDMIVPEKRCILTRVEKLYDIVAVRI